MDIVLKRVINEDSLVSYIITMSIRALDADRTNKLNKLIIFSQYPRLFHKTLLGMESKRLINSYIIDFVKGWVLTWLVIVNQYDKYMMSTHVDCWCYKHKIEDIDMVHRYIKKFWCYQNKFSPSNGYSQGQSCAIDAISRKTTSRRRNKMLWINTQSIEEYYIIYTQKLYRLNKLRP
tara:strand:+ start:3855 stop:4385 length:531 start_codon:yes stop_codon:yes gene_type:complete